MPFCRPMIRAAGPDTIHVFEGCPLTCPWDCGNGDGIIGIDEFLQVLGTWGQVGVPCDVNGDGVGIDDFLAVLGLWGPCP